MTHFTMTFTRCRLEFWKKNTIYIFWDQHKKVWGFLDNEKRRDFFWLFKKIEKMKEDNTHLDHCHVFLFRV